MKILFLDTSSFFVSIAIVDNSNILYKYNGIIKDDMSSKIMPLIREGFNSIDFDIKNIDKIMVVNGPGSFTGVRIGVTVAKTIAWSLKKDIITISSLEYLATTNCNTKYIIPMIDARRGFVFSAVYDSDLNIIERDCYTAINSFDKYLSSGTIVSNDDIDGSINPNYDIIKIINKHINDIPQNPHSVKPEYLKLTEAEEKLKKND